MKSILILIVLMTIFNQSCRRKIDTCTPQRFLNHVKNERNIYLYDSLKICKQIILFMSEHQNFFFSKKDYQCTQIIIDTIIYNKTYDKMSIFIITKTPINKQLTLDKKHFWDFNGTCYLGSKSHQSINLSWFGPNLNNANNQIELSNLMRETYFCELSLIGKDNNYEFNLNDNRFWNSSIWYKHFPLDISK